MQPEVAIEHVLGLARQSGLAEVDVLVERGESLGLKIRDAKVEKVDQSTSLVWVCGSCSMGGQD